MAGAFALGACSSGAGGPGALVALFDASGGEIRPGFRQRLPFALADRAGVLLDGAPRTLAFSVSVEDEVVVSDLAVEVRREGLPRPYFPLVFEPTRPGIHGVTAVAGDDEVMGTVLVAPGQPAIRPGEPLVAVQTPTPSRPGGVSPICSRRPACGLHTISLADALDERRPVGLLLASPGWCDTSLCPPALELVLDVASRRPEVRFIHAEVYAGDPSTDPTTTRAYRVYGLGSEPSLLLADRRGLLTERLDHIFDLTELDEAVDRARE